MAISITQQTEISKVVVGLFNAAPGSVYLSELAALVEGGMTPSQLADTLAASPAFTTGVLNGKVTIDSQVDVLMHNFGITAGSDASADAKHYFTDQLNANVGFGQIVFDAGVFLLTTTDPKFTPIETLLENKAKVASAYSNIPSSITDLSTLQNVLAGVKGDKPYTDADVAAILDKVNPAGETFTLTTGVDVIAGTSGNDTIIADNTGTTKQLSAADQINGGAGTADTLKIYLAAADTATGQPALSNIENVWTNGGAITAYTAATGTTGLIVEAPVANTAATYTLAGQDLTLQSFATTAATTTTVAKDAAGTQTAQKITLNGFADNDPAAVLNTIDVTGAGITTLNLMASGANSETNLANTVGAAIKTVNISGDKNLNVAESAAMVAAVTTIDASAATGKVSVDVSAGALSATFKYTGGAGTDTVKFADGALALLTSGSQLNGGAGDSDKISILDTALDATETARLNQATGFEVLGLNAAITLNAGTLTGIKSFSVDTTALTQTISNMATGSTTTITAAAPTSLTLGTATGINDTSVVLGNDTSAGITVAALVTTGITNVTVTSNGTAANAITALTNSDNSVFTLKGAQDLTLALAAGTAVGSQVDGSAATGKLTLTGSQLVGSGDVIKGGSGNDTIDGGKGADTLTGGAGVDTFKFDGAAAANSSGATFGQADVITDFVAGTDKLQFAGVADVVSGEQATVQSSVTALVAGSTDAQIATAMATANTTNLGVSFAVFGGNTYALYETAGASTGVAADDVFVKLAGVTTLPTFAADVIA